MTSRDVKPGNAIEGIMNNDFEKWWDNYTDTTPYWKLEGRSYLAREAWQARQPEIDALKADIERYRGALKPQANFISSFAEARMKTVSLKLENAALKAEVERLKADAERYQAINTPEIHDFTIAVEREALHQRDRWGNEHDAGKTDADWFWLLGYLAGKAVRPDATPEKQLHHIITTAAACLNWHAAKLGVFTNMRPGIGEPK